MFEAYFFDKHADTTYRLFKLLKSLNGAPFTINKLSKQLGLSYQQTYNAYQDIMADLRHMQANLEEHHTFTGEDCVMNSMVKRSTDAVENAEPENEMSFNEVAEGIHVDNYRFHLLQNSLTFCFFDRVFKNDGINVTEFCRECGISMSTLRRRVEPFRDFLQNNRIQIDPGTWEIHGGELVIRQLLTSFYNEGYRGAGWPFTNVDRDQVKKVFNIINDASDNALGIDHLSVATKRNIITIGVQLMRMQQGHFFTVNPRLQLLLRNFGELDNLVFTQEYFPDYPESTLHAERNYYYCARIGQTIMSTQDTRASAQLREYLSSFNNPVDRFVTGLFDALTADLENPEALHLRADKVLMTNMYKVVFLYYVMDGNFVKPSDFADTSELLESGAPLLKKITDYIEGLPKTDECHLFHRYLPAIAQSLFTVFIPELADFYTTPTLNVKLEMEAQSFITRDMLNYLRDSSTIRIMNSDTQEVPDLIITSVPNVTGMYDVLNGRPSVDSGVPTFYWGTDNHDADLYNLFKQLTIKAEEKRKAKKK
ncbi:helix-turn-helix domain-containing protein [Lacticaseibacillus hulanensis]|uniref:helix-turn-helix domain-containing protein n=1 Tax=Lacticaseibacillus hulanensis TaxID=2493111 RepID=UPI000FD9382A|nr:helix-turn-helix domain-containing protein [Lacticaseibacillus hulanensis]